MCTQMHKLVLVIVVVIVVIMVMIAITREIKKDNMNTMRVKPPINYVSPVLYNPAGVVTSLMTPPSTLGSGLKSVVNLEERPLPNPCGVPMSPQFLPLIPSPSRPHSY